MNEVYAIWDVEKNTITGEYSMEDIIGHAKTLPKERKFLSCYAIYGSETETKVLHDHNGNMVKEFDVLTLPVTEELMETSFNNSNLGKDLKKEGNVKNVIVALSERNRLYEIFYERDDGYIKRYLDGKIESEGVAKDDDFIFYLVNKGAGVVANLKTCPDYITQRVEPLTRLENAEDFENIIVLTLSTEAYVFDKESGMKVAKLSMVQSWRNFDAWWYGDYSPFLERKDYLPANPDTGEAFEFNKMAEEMRNAVYEDALAEIKRRVQACREWDVPFTNYSNTRARKEYEEELKKEEAER